MTCELLAEGIEDIQYLDYLFKESIKLMKLCSFK
jgi:hypothetical protein